jgi:heptaprenyl diphosphate synthase
MAELRAEKGFLHRAVAPLPLFVFGLLTIPAFLFQEHLPIKVGQALLFAGLASLAGKKIKWLYFVIMVGSITAFHVLTPLGRVLVEFGPIRVTQGALRLGLLKGFTIVGLVFLSLGTISRDLKLPGSLGGLIGRLFYYFERILDTKSRVEAKNLIPSLDRILDDLYAPGQVEPAAGAPPAGTPVRKTTPAGFAAISGLVVVNWALLLV